MGGAEAGGGEYNVLERDVGLRVEMGGLFGDVRIQWEGLRIDGREWFNQEPGAWSGGIRY